MELWVFFLFENADAKQLASFFVVVAGCAKVFKRLEGIFWSFENWKEEGGGG